MKNEFLKTHFAFGLSLPSGGIDERDATPTSLNSRLGYKMQNGSGTFDPFFVINNVSDFRKVKLGKQFQIKNQYLDITLRVIVTGPHLMP